MPGRGILSSLHGRAEDLADRLEPRFLLPMHLSKSDLYRTVDLYGELCSPLLTVILLLSEHLVPVPFMVRDVEVWLQSPVDCKSIVKQEVVPLYFNPDSI